jgi:hypothetical protein
MLDKIKTLLEEKPNHAIRIMSLNPELWNWILENCDPNCTDKVTFPIKIIQRISDNDIF